MLRRNSTVFGGKGELFRQLEERLPDSVWALWFDSDPSSVEALLVASQAGTVRVSVCRHACFFFATRSTAGGAYYRRHSEAIVGFCLPLMSYLTHSLRVPAHSTPVPPEFHNERRSARRLTGCRAMTQAKIGFNNMMVSVLGSFFSGYNLFIVSLYFTMHKPLSELKHSLPRSSTYRQIRIDPPRMSAPRFPNCVAAAPKSWLRHCPPFFRHIRETVPGFQPKDRRFGAGRRGGVPTR